MTPATHKRGSSCFGLAETRRFLEGEVDGWREVRVEGRGAGGSHLPGAKGPERPLMNGFHLTL